MLNLGHRKILVVDDSRTMRRRITQLLKGFSASNIHAAENGKEALTMLESDQSGQEPYEMIFSDINMPVMNGMEFLEEVKSRPDLSEIPFVLVSSEGDQKIITDGLRLGAVTYLKKPLQSDNLKKTLQEILNPKSTRNPEDIPEEVRSTRSEPAKVSEFFNAFGEAVVTVLQHYGDLKAELAPHIDAAKSRQISFDHYVGCEFKEPCFEGIIVISLQSYTYKKIMSYYYDDPFMTDIPNIEDSLVEFSNMVFGNARGALNNRFNYSFNPAFPKNMKEEHLTKLRDRCTTSVLIPVETLAGIFTIDIVTSSFSSAVDENPPPEPQS